MDQIKHHTLVNSIADSLMTGRPLSREWGFPSFMLKNDQMLSNFFGQNVYDIYISLNSNEKEQFIKWFEIHGIEATDMYGGELYEDWSGHGIAKRNIKLLKETNPNIYADVVSRIIKRAYETHPNIIDQIIEKCNDPDILESILKSNVG